MTGIYDVNGNLITDTQPKNIKILGIGNSYTRDSLRWVWKILKELGYDNVVVAHGYWGGSTLAQQYAALDSTSFEYWKYTTSQNATKTSSKTLNYILADETWDVVVFQQQSDDAGQYDSFVSDNFDINNFITAVKTAINNANLRIGIALTWSHANGYSGDKYASYYNSNPATQLAAIKTVIPQVANHMSQCDFVVNTGIAIEQGRLNTYLGALGSQMLRSDKNHLQYGIPSYMAGLVYALTICNVDITELTWYPTATDEGESCTTSQYLAYLAKQCARYAKEFFEH